MTDSKTSLHAQIINLPVNVGLAMVNATDGQLIAYKIGHRDARHAAAELANEADADIERLRAYAERLLAALAAAERIILLRRNAGNAEFERQADSCATAARAALSQPLPEAPAVSHEPPEVVAWATHHEPPMLFPTRGEALQYCDDDEAPIALVAIPEPPK
jgi:hypothetical protein